MLKTNSKKARENVKQWILDNLGPDYEAGSFTEPRVEIVEAKKAEAAA